MLYKKKLDTCFDTHGIKIGVQLWRRVRDSIMPLCRCGRARSEQCSTGALHLDWFESPSSIEKVPHPGRGMGLLAES